MADSDKKDTGLSNNSRREFMRLTGLGVVGAALAGVMKGRKAWAFPAGVGGRNSSSGLPPNIIMMLIDDMGFEIPSVCDPDGSFDEGNGKFKLYDTKGVYDKQNNYHPGMDDLMSSGVLCANAMTMPLCCPTRTTMLTGKYPYISGIKNNPGSGPFTYVNPALGSWAAFLRSPKYMNPVNGATVTYDTCAAGKWQLAFLQDHPEHPAQFGFNNYCLWNDTPGNQTSRYWHPTVWQGAVTPGSPYADPMNPSDVTGTITQYDSKSDLKAGNSFLKYESYSSGYVVNKVDGKGAYGPDLFHQFILDYIDATGGSYPNSSTTDCKWRPRPVRDTSKPFAIYYPTPLVHSDWFATPESPYAGSEGKTYFPDMVHYVARLVGDLMDHVQHHQDPNVANNTVIIVMADNGTDHHITSEGGSSDVGGDDSDQEADNIIGGKGSFQDTGAHVPLAVWGANIQKGPVVLDNNYPIDVSDFFYTIWNLAGQTRAQLPAPVTADRLGHSFIQPIVDADYQNNANVEPFTRLFTFTNLNNAGFIRQKFNVTVNGAPTFKVYKLYRDFTINNDGTFKDFVRDSNQVIINTWFEREDEEDESTDIRVTPAGIPQATIDAVDPTIVPQMESNFASIMIAGLH